MLLLFFLGASLKVHRILQQILHIFCKGDFIRSHGVGMMLLTNIAEDMSLSLNNDAHIETVARLERCV